MKALVYHGAQKMVFEEAADPQPGEGDLLIRVGAVGICGSDMHAYQGHDERRPPPLILGHEAAGHVVGGARDGEAVVVNPLVTCGRCPRCLEGRDNLCSVRQIISMPPRQGAFAELLTMPERNVLNLPDGMGLDKAALAEPLATAWHVVMAAQRLGHRALSEGNALIIGGGAIGLGAALVLRAHGLARITVAETNETRHATLRAAGDFQVVDPRQNPPQEGGYSLVIDAVGANPTREMASGAVAPGGVIVHVGIQEQGSGLEMRRLTLQEVAVTGTYAYTMTDFQATLRAMADGLLGDLDWFAPRPLAEGGDAFGQLLEGRIAAAKVVLLA